MYIFSLMIIYVYLLGGLHVFEPKDVKTSFGWMGRDTYRGNVTMVMFSSVYILEKLNSFFHSFLKVVGNLCTFAAPCLLARLTNEPEQTILVVKSVKWHTPLTNTLTLKIVGFTHILR